MSPLALKQQMPSGLAAAGVTTQRSVAENSGRTVDSLLPAGTDRRLLPAAVLRCLFDCLPLSAQGQCALVCRSWYASLPDTRRQLARWWEQLSPLQRTACRDLALGYSQRIRPFLVSQSSQHLLALERQHQELWRLKDRLEQETQPQQQKRAGQGLEAAQCLFRILVAYSLFQSLVKADRLVLQPVTVPGLRGAQAMIQFSPCSRWLACIVEPKDSEAPARLQLYGWQPTGWQPELLARAQLTSIAEQAVELVCFNEAVPDCLFSAHGDGQLISWHRNSSSGVWNPEPVLKAGPDYRVWDLMANSDRDLFVLLRAEEGTHRRVLVLHNSKNGHGWRCLSSQDYRGVVTHAATMDGRQMAIATRQTDSGSGPDWLHIQGRGLQVGGAGGWVCVSTRLQDGQRLLALRYGPDGRHLIGWMASLRACLWQVDGRGALQLRLDLACLFDTSGLCLQSMRPFHHQGKKLALAPSLHRIQFYVQGPGGRWHPGETLHCAPASPDRLGNSLRYVLWSGDGTLVRVTRYDLTLWCWNDAGRWQRQWQRVTEDGRAPAPHAWRLPPFASLCATSCGREGRLEIHAEGQGGQRVCTASVARGRPVDWWDMSPDGLSLALSCGRSDQLVFLQLVARSQIGEHQGAAVPPVPSPGGIEATAAGQLEPARERRLSSAAEADAVLLLSQPAAAQLPRELLERILSYLPLSDHSQCALVCRSWYASLPVSRQRLARWLQAASFAQLSLYRHLSLGYPERSRAFLRAWKSPWWPLAERQYMALLCHQARQVHKLSQGRLQQAAAARQALETARRWLSGLLYYSLDQQMRRIGPDQLPLQAVPVFLVLPPPTIRFYEISPCCRRLAFEHQLGPESPGFLAIYGKAEGGWRPETLQQHQEPVRAFRFSQQQSDTLFSVHGHQLLLWRRAAATGGWHWQQLWSGQLLNRARALMAFDNGDLVVPLFDREADKTRFLFFHGCHKATTGLMPDTHTYNTTYLCWGFLGRGCQLALGLPGTGPEHYDNAIHIWYPEAAAADPGKPWRCRRSTAGCHEVAMSALMYTADCNYLLVLFANQQLNLIAVDAGYGLCEQLSVLCAIRPGEGSLYNLTAFRNDSQQLAVPYSSHKIQLWDRDDEGIWQVGDLIARPSDPDADPQEVLRELELSSDGRHLAIMTNRAVEIWQKDGVWQRRVQYAVAAGETLVCLAKKGDPPPLGLFFCTAATDPAGTLSIYGPDDQGRMIRKCQRATGAPLRYLGSGADGLSLLAVSQERCLMMQLAGPIDVQADGGMEEPL